MKPLFEAHEKKIRAVELFAEGHSYSEIAKTVGFTNRGSAYRAVMKGLSTYGDPRIEDLRAREFNRLDRLLNGVWDRAISGDLQATEVALEISRQRRRWCGWPPNGFRHR